MGSLRDDLRDPSAYPGEPDGAIELIETHVSWVFLRETEVLKVKKPLDLGFLDFRTLEQRREACEAEVRLNRRLSSDVYLDVVPIRLRQDGRHHLGNEGVVVDYGVRMRRLPDEKRADHLLARGELDGTLIDEIARTLVRFHEEASTDEYIASFGSTEVIEKSVRENFEQTRGVVHRYLEASQAQAIESYQLGFLRDRAASFRRRAENGRVRDGHGDLRLEHIYLREDGSLTIIDCIEFNERFRYADVAADIAFLAMDLAFHGRLDLGERLLATYAREAGDYDLYELIDFYRSYRAYVRAKVSTFLADDEGASSTVREKAALDARRYFLLALSIATPPPTEPMVIAVGGVLASGKSTIANQLGSLLSVPVVEADRTRKELLGISPWEPVHERAWQGAYSPSRTAEVYDELFQRAGVVLDSGRTIIVDASFRAEAMRRKARELAEARSLRFVFVECRAPHKVCRERLRRREREGAISDGRLAIFDEFCARWEPVVELPPSEHLVLDTSGAIETSVRELEAWLGLAPLSPRAER